MLNWSEGAEAMVAFCLAGLAGIVAFLQQFTDPEKDRKWIWRILFIKLLTAGFAGLLCLWLLPRKGLDERLLYFFIAMAGWGGGETISFLQSLWRAGLQLLVDRQTKGDPNNGPKV